MKSKFGGTIQYNEQFLNAYDDLQKRVGREEKAVVKSEALGDGLVIEVAGSAIRISRLGVITIHNE